MRTRPKKHRSERMEAVSELFALVNDGKIDINATFSYIENASELPLYLEIGCGKGAFITALSKRQQDAKLIALEKVPDVIMLAMEKARKEGCDNVRFLMCDVADIAEIFPEHSIDRLYINFCDPWPKARNAKRRLTSPLFLERYKTILSPNAKIYFKTDNRPLFDYSVEQFIENGYTLENVIYDLHSSPLNETNIRTEYENNFSAKGFAINYLEAQYGDGKRD